MKRVLYFAFMALMLTLGTAVAQAGSPSVKNPASEALPLKEGMPYADARAIILKYGYRPFRDPQCLVNTMGATQKEDEIECKKDPNNRMCRSCREVPELSICSGDGYCNMFFKRGNKLLKITVRSDYGDAIYWDNDYLVEVTGWRFVRRREE
jgi:hypothetical protein